MRPIDVQLMQAVQDSDYESVCDCLTKGADVHLMTTGQKPLIFFAIMRSKNAQITINLLRAKARTDLVDETGNTLIHLWARATRARDDLLTMGEELIRHGVDLDAQRDDGLGALHLLVAGNNKHCGWLDYHKAALLVRHGACTQLRAVDGSSPLELLKPNAKQATVAFTELLCRGQGKLCDLPTCECSGCIWCCENRVVSF
jgi:hypothetical protein